MDRYILICGGHGGDDYLLPALMYDEETKVTNSFPTSITFRFGKRRGSR